MSARSFRAPCLAALASVIACVASPSAAAEAAFDIAPQALDSALTSFARQAGVQILFPAQAVRGRRAPAVQGRMASGQALRRLIAGTGLRIVSESAKMVVLAASGAAADAPGQTTPTAAETSERDEIIVTGSTRATRKFDVSYAATTLSNEEIKKLAPLNFADLLGQVPGIYAESTGGEVQNVFRVRGIPDSLSFQAFQQDGMPVFQDNDGVYFKSDTLNRIDLMTRNVEFVRGGPAPIFASNAAAIYNQITVRGRDKAEGAVQMTVGDTDLYRLDAYAAGPLGGNNYYAIGGFIRRNQGYRDNSFPADRGGQIRANLVHDFESGGYVRASVLYINDHNQFYLPTPVADPTAPSVSLDPYIDFFTGSLNSPALRRAHFLYPDGAGGTAVMDRDVANGRHTQMINLGLDFERSFGDWLVTAKLRYTDGRTDFDALYSTTNPVNADTFAASYLAAAKAAFNTPTATVARLGYAVAGTNGLTAYDPTVARNLVISGQFRAINSKYYSAMGDLRVARTFAMGAGHHDLALGLYAAGYGNRFSRVYQDYLFELKGQPRTLDLVAYSATGAVLGSVTDNGVLKYASSVNAGDTDVTLYALYANDTWQVNDRLRLDAGIRHERYDYNGYGLAKAYYNLGDATTLADDKAQGYTGVVLPRDVNLHLTNWTFGANYDFSRAVGVYGRVSRGEQAPGMDIVYGTSAAIITRASQYEAGIKFATKPFSLYLTGFYTKFDPFDASFAAINPKTGTEETLNFVGSAKTYGVEADASVRPLSWFSLDGTITVSNPTVSDLKNDLGADPLRVEGNQLKRQPKTYGNLRPTVYFDLGDAKISTYARWNYVGRRFVDFYNQTELPAYNTLGAGLTAEYGTWQFQVVGDNLTNTRGLSEGNPRTDALNGQGTAEAVYGRTLYGRNFRFVLTKRW